MTKWTVVWEESAEINLGNIWFGTGQSPKVTEASHQVDKALKADPYRHGKALAEGLMVIERPPRLPCTGITRLVASRLDFGRQRYYASVRLPERHLSSSLIPLLGHTRPVKLECLVAIKNLRVSLVA